MFWGWRWNLGKTYDIRSTKNIQKQGILHDPAGLLDVETGAVQVLFVTERAEDFQLALLTPKVWRVLSHRGTAISVGGLALWQSDSYPQLRARQWRWFLVFVDVRWLRSFCCRPRPSEAFCAWTLQLLGPMDGKGLHHLECGPFSGKLSQRHLWEHRCWSGSCTRARAKCIPGQAALSTVLLIACAIYHCCVVASCCIGGSLAWGHHQGSHLTCA